MAKKTNKQLLLTNYFHGLSLISFLYNQSDYSRATLTLMFHGLTMQLDGIGMLACN